ncbi:MAG: DUF5996 family protein [Usitatibacter sp.]
MCPSPKDFAMRESPRRAARYDTKLGEFILPYEAVRTSGAPEDALMSFLESTYRQGADLARWDRAALER